MITFRSVNLFKASRRTVKRKSEKRSLSWISSTITCDIVAKELKASVDSADGPELMRVLSNTPFVQKLKSVRGETLDSNLIWNPTVCPTFSPLSNATLSAIVTAASLLGSVQIILQGDLVSEQFSRMNCGTCVVLPDPVSPVIIVT